MWEQCAEVYVLPPPDLVNDPSRSWRRAKADNHAVAVPWGWLWGASALSGTLPSDNSGAAPAGLGGSSMLLAAVAHGSATPPDAAPNNAEADGQALEPPPRLTPLPAYWVKTWQDQECSMVEVCSRPRGFPQFPIAEPAWKA